MILETYGAIKSLFPFIKEIFLWRDGAEVGKPITKKDLLRRKIATYAMAVSLFFNYAYTVKIIQLGSAIVSMKKEITELNAQNLVNASNANKAKEAQITTAPLPQKCAVPLHKPLNRRAIN